MENKVLIIVSGTASGKSTVIRELVKKHKFKEVKYFTTKPKRNELDNDYNFVSDEKFYEMLESGKFIEHRKYFVNVKTEEGKTRKALWKYATAKTLKVDNTLQVMQLSIDGALEVYKHLNEQAVLVYLDCDESIRRERALKRGDLEAEVDRRLRDDRKFAKMSEQNCHRIVPSDRNLEDVVQDILEGFEFFN
jgi:guanylate kinase